MVLQLQTHGLLGVYVSWESHSFPKWSSEDDYDCREHSLDKCEGAVLWLTQYIKLHSL